MPKNKPLLDKLRARPTLKQKLFAQEYVKNGGNATKAAMAIYDVKDRLSAKSMGGVNNAKPIVQQEIKMILEKAGLGIDNVSDKLHDAIEQGLSSGKASVDTALRGIDMVLKLNNAYPANKSIKMTYSRIEQATSKNMNEIQQQLQRLNEATSSLLATNTHDAQ